MDNIYSYYKIGGLEKTEEDKVRSSVKIDGIEYVVSDRFKASLRDTIIDWEEFKKFHEKTQNDERLFEHVLKLMNIPDIKKIQEEFSSPNLLKRETLSIVKKIYALPLENHLVCLSSQYFLREPLSHAIHFVFLMIKRHFEEIVELFADCRNRYLESKDVEPQDFEKLLQHWVDTNSQQSYDTSSVVLFFLNPPENSINEYLQIEFEQKTVATPQINQALKVLSDAILKFKYPGFCPKVPKERLDKLLEFPIKEFADAIQLLGCEQALPDYSRVEAQIEDIIKRNHIENPIFKEENYERAVPPKELSGIPLIKWYMDAILQLRKKIVPHAKKIEDYYTNQAKLFNEIGQFISRTMIINDIKK